MNKDKVKNILIITEVIIFVILLILNLVFKMNILLALLIQVVSVLVFIVYTLLLEQNFEQSRKDIEQVTSKVSNDALKYGDVGLLIYDKEYIVTWTSDFFTARSLSGIKKKLTAWFPETIELLNGEVSEIRIELNEDVYLVSKQKDYPALFFKDITSFANLEKNYHNDSLVLALVHFDNYDDTIQYEDEKERADINTYIRTPAINYFSSKGAVIRQLKASKYLLVLNEKIFQTLVDDHFSVLNQVRKASKSRDVAISLSMSIARGGDSLTELEENCNELLELALSRGGDQIVIRKNDEDVKFYGGNRESQDKTSKVRVRVMAHTLRNLLVKSKTKNVIIVGHKEMDSDCLSAALIMSNIVQAYKIPVSIISKTGGIEPQINEIMNIFNEDLKNKHNFITESEAINQLKDDTLVIMVDHHNFDISNGQKILKDAKSIVIFDHHRRQVELKVNPTLIYIEPSSSSTTELLYEFIPYLSKDISFNSSEANIMYIGIMIDTNHFINRTGSRTFDVLSKLRQSGADPILCDELLEENYELFMQRHEIMKTVIKYNENIAIAAIDNSKIYSRTILSIVANRLLKIKNIKAAFVIAYIADDEVAISARSKGEINVQVIMEKMHGGGHLTQAAMQREKTTINEVNEELKEKLEIYLREEFKDESNNVS